MLLVCICAVTDWTCLAVDSTHSVIKADTSLGNITLNLPDPTAVSGRKYTIIKTDKSINKLFFTQAIFGSEFVFTEANVPGAYHIQSDGVVWNLIKKIIIE